jgi:hypothetical protein
LQDFTTAFIQLIGSGALIALLVFAVRTAVDTIKTVVFGYEESHNKED